MRLSKPKADWQAVTKIDRGNFAKSANGPGSACGGPSEQEALPALTAYEEFALVLLT